MGAADFDNIGKRAGFFIQRGAQFAQCRQQIIGHRQAGRNVHRGRKNIVGRLTEIDLIIRMHGTRCTAYTAQQLRCAIGEHFVHVHIGLCAGTGLPH